MIDLAKKCDLRALLKIEEEAFESDRITIEAFYSLLRKNGTTLSLLAGRDEDDLCIGYILVLYSRQNKVARIHSYAVSKDARGTGLGAQLIEAACYDAKYAYNKLCIRTEVRVDNPHALARYEKSGFRRYGSKENYYADGCASFSYEKELV